MVNKVKKPQVDAQVNYHIIPFAFNKSYQEVIKIMNKNKNWNSKAIEVNGERLLEHVNHLVSLDPSLKDSIAAKYELKDGNCREYGLLNKDNIKYKIHSTKKAIDFNIKSIDLYLFKTQVGFIALDVVFIDNDIDNIIEGNYLLKELKRESTKKTYLSYERKVSKDEKIDVDLRIKDLILQITEKFDVITYFEYKNSSDNGNKQNQILNNSLVYNAVLLKNEDQNGDFYIDKAQVKEYLFRMRRSFKASYKSGTLESNIIGNDEIIEVFENSYWGVSLEGICNIVYNVNDNVTNEFFKTQYFEDNKKNKKSSKLKNIYFCIYLMALHQRYSLLYFSILSSRLPESINECRKLVKEGHEMSIYNLKEKMAFFTLKCSYTDISNVTHKAKLYDSIRRSLRIERLMKELDFEINALSTLTELIEEEERREEDKRRNRFNDHIVKITTLFTVIATIAASNDLAEVSKKIQEELDIGILKYWNTGWFLLLLLLSIIISNIFIRRYKIDIKVHKNNEAKK